MADSIKLLLLYIWNSLLVVTRYLLVSVLFMLAGLCLMTGKFPPQLGEIYKSFSEFQSSMDLSKNMTKIAKSQEAKKEIMKELEQIEQIQNAPLGNQPSVIVVDPQAKIRALEYEVAYLKSKLARAQWEAQNAQNAQMRQANHE